MSKHGFPSPDDDPKMELWVSRAAMETVMRAAMTLDSEIGDVGNPISIVVRHAVETIQKAVADAWEDPLDTTLL